MDYDTKLFFLIEYGAALRTASNELREARMKNEEGVIEERKATYELKKRCYDEFYDVITSSVLYGKK
jgi:hypothetical protein